MTTPTFTFIRGLTGVVVLLYIGAAIGSLVWGDLTWKDFNGSVGPMASMLLGYWVRGEQ